MAFDIFASSMSMDTPQACIVDLTPPAFAGIASLVAQPNGSLLATWLAGSDVGAPPVQYKIYMQLASESSGALFSIGNYIKTVNELSDYIFTDRSNGLLIANVAYRVGVRAVDAVNNEETNLVSLTATSSGVLSGDLLTIANLILGAAGQGGTVLTTELIETVMDVEIIEEVV